MGYIAQLRSLGLVEGYFLPNLWHILKLDLGTAHAFRLDPWQVDEYYVQCAPSFLCPARVLSNHMLLVLDTGNSFSVSVFAAHLYYRSLLAVRSLVQTWVLDCKDRQLSTAITTYTSQYFSPVIIQAEFAHLKAPDILADLTDESMTVKIAQVVNEVIATYLVDEQQLEIKLKIPTDWPLHRIEVKESKHAGVDDNRWRAWVFNVQQIIWSQVRPIYAPIGAITDVANRTVALRMRWVCSKRMLRATSKARLNVPYATRMSCRILEPQVS